MNTSPVELKQIAIANSLRCCQFFAGMSTTELAVIAGFTVVKSVPKGGYLFREGDPSSGFYVVQTGAINIHRVNAVGREQVIHVFRAGESFAEGSLATEKGYPADARAVEPSQVLLVQKAGMLGLLRRQPALALRMLGSLSAHLRILVAQLEDLTLKDVETRLVNWILKRCPDPAGDKPHRIVLTMTKRVLASELGTVSETLSRTLAKLREQQLVEVRGRAIVVLRPSQLAALLRRHLGG